MPPWATAVTQCVQRHVAIILQYMHAATVLVGHLMSTRAEPYATVLQCQHHLAAVLVCMHATGELAGRPMHVAAAFHDEMASVEF
jgi:hypothetical protein